MASGDRPISELPAASQVTESDLFVLQQNDEPKKLTGLVLIRDLLKALASHGGIKEISLSKTVGLLKVYTITYVDGDTFDFEVWDGAKGDKGDAGRVWIKYASQKPTEESHTMSDVPDEWIGICTGFATSLDQPAPTDWSAYTWYKFKGPQGESIRGEPGVTPKLSIGTVTTVEADQTASASIGGTPENPILHLSLPRGKAGRDGAGAPDWEAIAGSDGHILNRTHYHISDEVPIGDFPLTFSSKGIAEMALSLSSEAGRLYRVRWMGRDFYLEARDITSLTGETALALGNLSLLDETYLDTAEPFCIRYAPETNAVTVTAPDFASLTVTLGLAQAAVVKKLDNEYLDLEWVPTKEVTGIDGPVCPSMTLEFTTNNTIAAGFVSGSLIEGCSYTVYWNGTAYEAECYKYDGSYYLGNGKLGGADLESDYPFCLVGFGGTTLLVYKETDTAENITLQVIGKASIRYNHLPREYQTPMINIAAQSAGAPGVVSLDFETAWTLSPEELQSAIRVSYDLAGIYYFSASVTHVNKVLAGSTKYITFNVNMQTLDAEYNNTLQRWKWHSNGTVTVETARTDVPRVLNSPGGEMLVWNGAEWVGKVPTEYYIMSPGGKKFQITVDDDGLLTTTAV